jgi:hypothetical protein
VPRFHVIGLPRQRLILDDGPKPSRDVVSPKVIVPGLIVHTIGKLHEQLEILSTEVQAPRGSTSSCTSCVLGSYTNAPFSATMRSKR